MKTYGNAGGDIEKKGFKEFMIAYYGDTDTKEEVLGSFKLINKSEHALPERMMMVMTPHDVEYVTATAPKVADGYDYKAWTEQVFSR